jgi:hypothetical protein
MTRRYIIEMTEDANGCTTEVWTAERAPTEDILNHLVLCLRSLGDRSMSIEIGDSGLCILRGEHGVKLLGIPELAKLLEAE